MKSKISILSKNNDFVGQFKALNINEMSNLKGGTKPTPPPPPSPGEDLPIILTNVTGSTSTSNSTQQLPVLNTQTTLIIKL